MRRIGTLNYKPIVEGDNNIVDKNSILYEASSGNFYKRNSKGKLESMSGAHEETDKNPFTELSNAYSNRQIIGDCFRFLFHSESAGQAYISTADIKPGSPDWQVFIPSSVTNLAVMVLDTPVSDIEGLKELSLSNSPREISEEELQPLYPAIEAHAIGLGLFSGADIPDKLVADNAIVSEILNSLVSTYDGKEMLFPQKTLHMTPS
jgi:hypothetical protein